MNLEKEPFRPIRIIVAIVALAACAFVGAESGALSSKGFDFAAVSHGFSSFGSLKVTKLDVPYFRQQYVNSCESASLRMALAYYGIETDDAEVLNEIGYKPRPRDTARGVWDDPHEQFVGFVDLQGNTNGYGVYGLPVARAAEEFGRTAEYRTVITPQFLAKEISEGHPVIVWGYTSLNESPYYWTTEEGKVVKAFRGEHARVVVGFRGPADKPVGFYVHDPVNGQKFQYWTDDKLIENIYGVFEVTNQAVVVR